MLHFWVDRLKKFFLTKLCKLSKILQHAKYKFVENFAMKNFEKMKIISPLDDAQEHIWTLNSCIIYFAAFFHFGALKSLQQFNLTAKFCNQHSVSYKIMQVVATTLCTCAIFAMSVAKLRS